MKTWLKIDFSKKKSDHNVKIKGTKKSDHNVKIEGTTPTPFLHEHSILIFNHIFSGDVTSRQNVPLEGPNESLLTVTRVYKFQNRSHGIA